MSHGKYLAVLWRALRRKFTGQLMVIKIAVRCALGRWHCFRDAPDWMLQYVLNGYRDFPEQYERDEHLAFLRQAIAESELRFRQRMRRRGLQMQCPVQNRKS